EASLLRAQRARRGSGCLALEFAMHPFVGAVLLRAGGPDALVNDTESHPPDVQRAQAVETRRGEGRAVVGPDRVRQTDLAKEPAEHGFGVLGPDRRQPAAGEEAAAEVIGDRERVAVAAVAGFELPFEVRGPDLVRSECLQQGGAGMQPLAAAAVF